MFLLDTPVVAEFCPPKFEAVTTAMIVLPTSDACSV